MTQLIRLHFSFLVEFEKKNLHILRIPSSDFAMESLERKYDRAQAI